VRVPSVLQTPAVRAFLLQALAFALGVVVVSAAEAVSGFAVPLLAWALLQGAIASGLSRVARLAPWWLLIQLLFPVAILAALDANLPPSLFLGAFLVFLVLYWTTFRTQVPYFPSTRVTWQAVASLLPEGPIRVVDIGSGFGGMVMHLAALRPECQVEGVELAPLPWFVSRLRALCSRSRARFLRCDYLGVDLATHDAIFAFLSPAAMPALWEKARSEMRPGSMLISYEFPIPDVPPDLILPPDNRGASLFVWHM
jgi:SAM-dependent methyltransferase